MHIDVNRKDEEKFKTAVFYCNTNNGSTMFESSLNETLDISVDGYEIKSDVITWQKDIDLQSAYGESVGFGSLFVQCEKFEADLLEEKMNN